MYSECDRRMGADFNMSHLNRRNQLLTALSHLDFIMFVEATVVETPSFNTETNATYWGWISNSGNDEEAVELLYCRKLIEEYRAICIDLKMQAEPQLKHLRERGVGTFDEDRGFEELLLHTQVLEEQIRTICNNRIAGSDPARVQYAQTVLQTILPD